MADWTDWASWLTAAGVVVVLEMFTGTFYLLMIAIGLSAGALIAAAGYGTPQQLVAAAVIGIAATLLLHRSRFGKSERRDATRDPNVNLDIGQALRVDNWNAGGNGPATARVMYRGAMWDVELAPHEPALPGTFVIRQVHGSRLIVAHSRNNS